MSERINDILKEVRVVLNDVSKHRWTDERLVTLISKGQQELCRKVPLLTNNTTTTVYPGLEKLQLPGNCVKLLTARSEAGSLPMVTMEEVDDMDPDWEESVGANIIALIVNNLSQRDVRPYPLLADGAQTQLIKFRYSILPPKISLVSSTGDIVVDNDLQVDSMWDEAITQYVIGKAFIDYGDTTSLSRAQVALGEYTAYLTEASRRSKSSFSKKKRTTGYNNKVASKDLGTIWPRGQQRF